MDVATIVDEKIDLAELMRFAKQYQEQLRRGSPSAVATFSYAHALIKSTKDDTQKGIRLLTDLLKDDTEDVPRRDCIFFLAIAHTRLKEYDRALAYLDVLLENESNNRQAAALKELINYRMKRDGLLGAAIIGGGIAVIGGLLIAAIASKRKS
ncbi:hypothetical protein AB6A40_001364 [Gnathostoma spinigerum]|uniref:Mitochondrial fission 1 protein n=1 Tax=Gnathostoma spinigerum TaxID=75299 RepID=A0ABD6EEA7_9BILA